MTDAIATIRHRLQLAADVTLAMQGHQAPPVTAAAELIRQVHVTVEHLICQLVERAMYP